MMDLLDYLQRNPMAYLIISLSLMLINTLQIRVMLYSLLKMHRSKTSVKRLLTQYSVFQRITFKQYWNNCLHAGYFGNFLICYHHLYLVISVVDVSVWSLFALGINAQPALWISIIKFVLWDIPILIGCIVLQKTPIKKARKRWRFERYHNTTERKKLL